MVWSGHAVVRGDHSRSTDPHGIFEHIYFPVGTEINACFVITLPNLCEQDESRSRSGGCQPKNSDRDYLFNLAFISKLVNGFGGNRGNLLDRPRTVQKSFIPLEFRCML